MAGRTWVFFLDLYDMTVYMFKHRDKEEVFMFFLVHTMWLFTNSNEETNETCVSRFIFFICV
jgi:hypothetical protein